MLGKCLGEDNLPGILGFLTSAVIVPSFGLIIMRRFHGNYHKLFEPLKAQRLIPPLLLLCWVVLGSGPRCVAISYQLINVHLPCPYLMYVLGYLFIVWQLSARRDAMIKALGIFLTPTLLIFLSILFYFAAFGEAPPSQNSDAGWLMGLKNGYYTMDLVAAIFFSKTIAPSMEKPRRFATSLLIGMGLLTIIYLGLILIAQKYGSFLTAASADQVLGILTHHTLPASLDYIAAGVMATACLTTSLALNHVLSSYLHSLGMRHANLSAVLLTGAMAIGGYQWVAWISTPLFEVLYPLIFLYFLWVTFFYKPQKETNASRS